MTVAAPSVTKLSNYINGQWTESRASKWLDITNPATAELLAQVPLSEAAEVNAAIEAAAAAYPEWRRTPPEDRIQPLFKLKQLLEDHVDELARIITLENGKTFTEAKAELRRAIENVEVACGIPMMMQGYNLEDVARGIDEIMIRQPLGVVAAITPFNFPGMISFWFLPYAIATGNTFVLKPSERVPLTMTRVFELIKCGTWSVAGPLGCGCRWRYRSTLLSYYIFSPRSMIFRSIPSDDTTRLSRHLLATICLSVRK